jgi:hypothetical protein
MSAARQMVLVDASVLRRVLGRVLAPGLVSGVIEEVSVEEHPKTTSPSEESIERHRRKLKEKRRLKGEDE